MSRIIVGGVRAVEVWAPSRSWFLSFFSSPYYPHIMCRALDISTSPQFGDDALSPVDGVVRSIKKIEAGPGPFSKEDYVIFIEARRAWIKIMHIEPRVRVGERVRVGDAIGRYIRTNFFRRHDLPHMHLEIHRVRSVRPTKAVPIDPSPIFLESALAHSIDANASNVVYARPVYVSDDYTLLQPVTPGTPWCFTISLRVGRFIVNGLLQRLTKYMGLIIVDRNPITRMLVRVFQSCVGYVKKIERRFSIALNSSYRFDVWLSRFEMSLINPGIDLGEMFEHTLLLNDEPIHSIELLISPVAPLKVPGRVEDSRVKILVQSFRRTPKYKPVIKFY